MCSSNRTRRRFLLRNERAQSLVEFALVLPIFLFMLMAIVDFGWAFRGYITATNSAREGARIGITGASTTDIKTRVVTTSSGVLSADEVFVTNAQGSSGSQLTVAVHYDYDYISPIGGILRVLTGGALPNTLPISATTTMRLE